MIVLWVTLAIVGVTGLNLYNRRILRHEHVAPYAFTLLYNFIAAILLIPIALSNISYSHIEKGWIVVFVASVLWACSGLVSSFSAKNTHASIRAPLSQSRLLWVLFFSVIILGESISGAHLVAVLLIFFGVSVLVYHKKTKFGSLKDNGVRWTLLGSFIGAGGAVADKYALGFSL